MSFMHQIIRALRRDQSEELKRCQTQIWFYQRETIDYRTRLALAENALRDATRRLAEAERELAELKRVPSDPGTGRPA